MSKQKQKSNSFIPNDIIGRIVRNVVGQHAKFQPEREFYKLVKIRQKRFWQLMRGDVSPTLDEIQAVAEYFKHRMAVNFPMVQLSIFDANDEMLKT